MKFCPNCGSIYGDSIHLCQKCHCELKMRVDPLEASKASKNRTNRNTATNAGGSRQSGPGASGNSTGAGNVYGNTAYGAGNPYNGTPYGKPPKRKIPFYEKTWFIVLCIFMFWPAAIAMIVLRIIHDQDYQNSYAPAYSPAQNPAQRPAQNPAPGAGTQNAPQSASAGTAQTTTKNKNKNVDAQGVPKYVPGTGNDLSGNTFRIIVGVILLVLGALLAVTFVATTHESTAPEMLLAAVICLASGGVLMGQALTRRSDANKFAPLINRRGNTRIATIASNLYMEEYKVRTKLQTLINKYFLFEKNGVGAYIDGEYDLVVMTYNGNPIVPVKETMKKELSKKMAEEEKARRAAPMAIEDRYHMVLGDNIKSIDDPEVKEYLQNIDKRIHNIRKLVAENKAYGDSKNIRNMRTKYIPKTIEYIDLYTKSTTSAEMKEQLEKMFATLDEAFENIEEQLVKRAEAGVDIELEVLKKTLENDGVLDSDFEIQE